MSKKAYLIIRSIVALAAFTAFFWLFLTPPTIQSKEGAVYSACHPVGWNFNGDSRSWDDDFDIESPTAVREYVDQTSGYRSEVEPADDVKKGIHRACKEARHERGIVIIAVVVLFGTVFVSIPKPKLSNGGRLRSGGLDNEPAHDESSSEPPGNECSCEPSDAGHDPGQSVRERSMDKEPKPADNESRFKLSGNESNPWTLGS